jgi:hypothetical protein
VGNVVKFVLLKIWIQFIGMPPHLRDFLIIWAVGSIMVVSKDVDMEFTRQHGISWMQVMVMNPNLIPHSVNIVIGEGLYELKFRVKMNGECGAPQPMDMDGELGGDGLGQQQNSGDPRGVIHVNKDFKGGDGGAASTGKGSCQGGVGQGSTKILPLFHIALPLILS